MIDDAIKELESLVASTPDIVIAVRVHPRDYQRLVKASLVAEAYETDEQREWRQKREAAVSSFVKLPPLASIPVHLDTTVPEGTPKLVRRSERADHEQWLESRR